MLFYLKTLVASYISCNERPNSFLVYFRIENYHMSKSTCIPFSMLLLIYSILCDNLDTYSVIWFWNCYLFMFIMSRLLQHFFKIITGRVVMQFWDEKWYVFPLDWRFSGRSRGFCLWFVAVVPNNHLRAYKMPLFSHLVVTELMKVRF